MKKLIITVLTLLLALAMFSGCTTAPPADKEFSKEGITITLTDRFSVYTGEEVKQYTVAYFSEKDNAVVIALKEGFSLFEAAGVSTDISLREYAQLTIDGSGIDSVVEESDGLTYFTFKNDTNSYFAVVYRGSDAYWLVQFSCYTENFDGLLDDFTNWAKTVKF